MKPKLASATQWWRHTKRENQKLESKAQKIKKSEARIFEEFNKIMATPNTQISEGRHRLFKTRVKFENYLIDTNNRKHRMAFTKLRLSDHNLMIEKGRHRRPTTPREYRFCTHFPLQVENEIHFLTTCNIYKGRGGFNELLYHLPNFNNLDDISKFTFLMSQENKLITKLLVTQVYMWVKTRETFIT